jgi:hypothetical protein
MPAVRTLKLLGSPPERIGIEILIILYFLGKKSTGVLLVQC